MNSKRRAELQRRLSMGAVPRPPAGLAERIKNDIPKYLEAEPERERFSRSIAFSMRIAASILLLITSVFVTLRYLEPDATSNMAVAKRAPVELTPAVMPLSQPQRSDKTETTASAAPTEEIRLEMTEELPKMKVAPSEVAAAQVAQNETKKESDFVRERDDENTGRRREAVQPQAISVTAAAPMIEPAAEAAPVPEPAPVPPPAMIPAAAAVAPPPPVPASAPARASSSLVREAYADNLDLGAKKNVFGISVDPNVFQRIKTSLENGQQPAPSMVNVDALVNYFAGAPARAPKRGVRLEVEASPAPVNEEGEHAVLRLTIDTPSLATQQGSSIPPVARDAHVEVDFNDEAVASYHRVGDANGMQSESVLLYNVSVTALYDVELRPHLRTSQRVATVKLRYRSVTDGKQHTIERIIHGHDLSGDWARASRRHRLASLGAVWGESLKGTPQGIDVARRAEELVTQNPKDPLARELAHAVSASGGER